MNDRAIRRLELWILMMVLIILLSISALILALYVDMYFESKIATPFVTIVFFVLFMYYVFLAESKWSELREEMKNDEE